MRAAIDHRVDPAFVVSRDDDRGLANRRCDIIAWIGNLGCETEEIPGRALEDPLLLDLVLLGIGVEPERDLGEAVRRPRNSSHLSGAELRHVVPPPRCVARMIAATEGWGKFACGEGTDRRRSVARA